VSVAELDQLDDDTPIGEVEAEMVLLALPGATRGEGLGVPPGREPPDMTGWTAKSLRACIDAGAEAAGVEPSEILRATRDDLITLRADVRRARAQARRDRAAELDERHRRERAERTAILPEAGGPRTGHAVPRPSRAVARAVHETARDGSTSANWDSAPPVRVEVTVE
jgi:hypothetical protein